MGNNQVGKFIQQLRKKKNLTQKELADQLFVTDKAVSKWERGLSFPDVTILNSLADILGVEASEILNGQLKEDQKLNSHTHISKKKKMVLFLLLFILVCVVIFWIFFKQKDSFPYQFVTTEELECSAKAKLYYQEGDRKIYTYCLSSIKVKEGENLLELKNFIQKKNYNLDEMIQQLTYTDGLWDGGTNIYSDGGNSAFSNHGLTVIQCHQMLEDGTYNNDIYFGPKDMEYKSNFCHSENTTYTKTYTILGMVPAEEEKSYYLTISLFQGEVNTVRVLSFYHNIEIGKTYEFEFTLSPDLVVDDTPKSIFENATIVSVKETDKTGLAQTQDPI